MNFLSFVPDTHAHLDLIGEDPVSVTERARAGGVYPIITIGIDLDSSRLAAGFAEKIPGVFASVGIHPNSTAKAEPGVMDILKEISSRAKNVVAIGETGLDYYRKAAEQNIQKSFFSAHIRLAKDLGKPLIIHDREAHSDILCVLDEERPDVPVVLHCFSGDREFLDQCLRRGYYISFAGPLTFPNAQRTREVAARVPLDFVLVETDAPFLSPHPFRGKKNYPERARLVAEVLSDIHGISLDEISMILQKNTAAIFSVGRLNDALP